MADTLTPEKWGRKESADWWSAGQAVRQQIYGAATEMMLDLAGVQEGSRVLDVASGSGESTLMAARRIGPTGYALAADGSANMLSAAADTANKAGMTNVETRVMNSENIDLDSESFDAVICRIALMLFQNPVKALSEMHRVAKPGGKVAVMVYSALEKNPYHAIFQENVRRLGNMPWPARGEPWMFALGGPGVLEGLYREAGFQNVSVHAAPIPRRFPSAAAVGNMRKAAGDLKELMAELKEADREIAWAEIEEKFKQFEEPNGLEIPGEVLIGVGIK